MELDEIFNPWIQQLEASLKPYLQFVNQASIAIAELEPQVNAALLAQSVPQPAAAESVPLMASAIQGIAPEKLQALERELADQQLIRKSQQTKIDELQAQIAVLKTALAEVKTEAQSLSRQSSSSNLDSTFEDTRPRRETRSVPAKIASFPERHVLLIDDAEINRVLMSHYFKGLPVKLEFAVSVAAALAKCKERRYDLIVIDDELPDHENPDLRASSPQVVGLSNHVLGGSETKRFEHVLSRGQAREAFIEQLKGFLWDAERIA